MMIEINNPPYLIQLFVEPGLDSNFVVMNFPTPVFWVSSDPPPTMLQVFVSDSYSCYILAKWLAKRKWIVTCAESKGEV